MTPGDIGTVLRLLPALLILAALVGGIVFVKQYLERQQARMRAVAAAAGLQVDVSSKKPPDLDFDLFAKGSGKRVKAQMWRAGEQDSVFQYQYTEGSGDNSTTYQLTVALVALPFRAPHTVISTENLWSRMKRAVGIRDIEVESPEFNDKYHVRSDDERFAITLLDPPTIAWMLSPHSGAGTITFELSGPWMLCYAKQLDIERLPEMLTWSQAVRPQLPAVLTDLYGS